MRLPAISSEEQDALFKDAYQTARIITARLTPDARSHKYKTVAPEGLPVQFDTEYVGNRMVAARLLSRLTEPSIREITSLNQFNTWTYVPAGDIDHLSELGDTQMRNFISARVGESLFEEYEDAVLSAEALASITEAKFALRAIKHESLRTYRHGASSLGVKATLEDGRPLTQQVVFRSEKSHQPDRGTKIEIAYSYGITHQNGKLVEPFATLEVASDQLGTEQLRDYAHAYARQNPTDYLYGCFDTLLEQIDDLDG